MTGNLDSPNSNGHLVIFEDLPCQYLTNSKSHEVKEDFVDALSSREAIANHQSKLEPMNDDLCKAVSFYVNFIPSYNCFCQNFYTIKAPATSPQNLIKHIAMITSLLLFTIKLFILFI
ncbi:unnamed protein product [Lactuca saligna]|uniref:Uncharacterized protein n=1 Tax=Lactuca saligna TaxID=75948 RepID=A0AA35Z7R6_LACSI|nr:unnamed protein product [Lactuca saligna]